MNIIDNIFPKHCLLCSRIGFDVCPRCLVKISHSLPTCCICNHLNNDFLTHRYCTDLNIQCFTGWYLTKDIEYKLKRKKDIQIYSVHKFLLEYLIRYLNITDQIHESRILPLPANDFKTKRLNTVLAKSMKGGKGEGLVLVGERFEDIQWLTNKKGLLLKKSQHIQIVTLFTQKGLPLAL